MYSYLKCIVYDKLLKPRQSFWITLYFVQISVLSYDRHSPLQQATMDYIVHLICFIREG